MNQSLPIIKQVIQPVTCDGCGACCMHFLTPPFDCLDPMGDIPFEERETDEDFACLPDHLKRELERLFETRGGGRDPNFHCPWFDPSSKRCVNYDHRPVICREFEPGNAVCLDIRREAGIPSPS